jgi:2-polyprenyl-3-methyl-5-hydroxy-6-metoxy-1,4-benzoquinol methylase
MAADRPCPICDSDLRQLVHYTQVGEVILSTVICLDCGLVYHHPRPTVREKMRAAHTDDESGLHLAHARLGKVTPAAARRAARYVGVLGDLLRPPTRFLDVGCGDGALLVEAGRRGVAAVGLEAGAQNAATARALSGAEVLEVHLEDADLAGRQFDLIACTHVLEHVEDPVRFLTVCRELLGPDGRLFIEVPNVMRPKMSFRRMFQFRHNFFFSPETLLGVLQRAGLRTVWRRTYRRECVAAQGVADPALPPPARNPAHAREVLGAIARHRWQYYTTGTFAWRKLHGLHDRVFYGTWHDDYFQGTPRRRRAATCL